MADQVTFAELAWNSKRKVTRRERFLKEMDAVIPWQRILPLIEPFYAKPGPGRPPLGLEKMLRISSSSIGTISPIPGPRRPSTRVNRYAGSSVSSWRRTRFLTNPPSSVFGTCWKNTI
jgi:hypothetical protein